MSLRARVVVGMAVIALVMAGSSYVITRSTQARLMEAMDGQVEEALGQAVKAADRHFGTSDPCDQDDTTLGDRPSPVYVGVLSPEGRTCTSFEPNVSEGAPLPTILPADAVRLAVTSEPFTVGSEDAHLRYRARAAFSDTGNVVVAALPLDDLDASVDRLIAVELAATLAVLGVLGLVAWWVIHLGVRPVKQMTATATAIAAGDLSPRVPEVDPGTEAGQLGRALNLMLGRIETAFDQRTRSEHQLRQFLADASHELRTPVTTIRGYAELYQAGGLDAAAELDEAMRRTGQEAVRMGALVDDMLLLARLDQGRPLQSAPVDIAVLVADAGRDAGVVDPERAISVDADGPLLVRGDGDRLRQVIANLVGNALVHTPAGTPVEITASVSDAGDRAVIAVVDHGPGMSDDAVAHAFERFYRADRSRSRAGSRPGHAHGHGHGGGSGLGLAIVHAIVTSHGGTVTLTSAEGQGTTARVELPLLGSDAPPPPPAAAAET